MRSFLLFVAVLAPAAAPAPSSTCEPVVAVPKTVTAPNSTYYADGLPPKRFSHSPAQKLTFMFGQDAINSFCGKPACGYFFEGCTDGKTIALPDPFTTDPQTFSRLLRHELAHINGWPDTHGD